MSYVLTGTADELRSHRALKVIATATASSLPLTRLQVSTTEQVALRTTCLAKSLALSIVDSNSTNSKQQHVGGTSHLMMRTMASHAPLWNRNGATDVDKAHVDAWLDFIWSSIDVPLEMMLLFGNDDDIIKKELMSALAIVESHLTYQTFLVGGDVTVADISLTAALGTASSHGFWKSSSHSTNVARYYDTMIHQDFWSEALKIHASTPASVLLPAQA
mmetsp:Transcript_21966/g.36350  ORF Transcript_21966/g.36350 Transcript_21966/m.36350 type:complete len:218 (-) Transcript_21966:197-850(-)